MKTLKEALNNFHWHFKIIAYKEMKDGGQLMEASEINILEAETEEEAMAIAKNKIKGKNYFLKEAWQCNKCGRDDDYRELFKKMISKM